ncbi:hypothetical protein LXL04_029333 [Taraxacum kok-saghyz]
MHSSKIWGMEKLEMIDLEGNLIHGSLQSHFSGLKNLRVLNLGFNQISGEIPNSISQFKNLQVLNLAGNHINGSIPRFLDNFGDLRGLYLSYPETSRLKSATRATLERNYFEGTIPCEITTLPNLKLLWATTSNRWQVTEKTLDTSSSQHLAHKP